MRSERRLSMMVPAILFSLICGLALTPGMRSESLSGWAVAAEQAAGWRLSGSRVIDQGQTAQNDEGALISGFTIEAAASGVGDAPVAEGTFLMTATIFAPKADMPGQKAGMYYVRGNWTITDERASASARKSRHSAAVIKGVLNAELSFNPAKEQGMVQAQVQLPMSPMGGWSRGKGSFTGNETFAGEMTVTLDRRPTAQ